MTAARDLFPAVLLLVFVIAAVLAINSYQARAQDLGGHPFPDCSEGEKIPCGSNIGACEQGIRTCQDGQWGDCVGDTDPETEICTNGLDDDCDGMVDECGSFLWMIMVGIGLLIFATGIAVAKKWTD